MSKPTEKIFLTTKRSFVDLADKHLFYIIIDTISQCLMPHVTHESGEIRANAIQERLPRIQHGLSQTRARVSDIWVSKVRVYL